MANLVKALASRSSRNRFVAHVTHEPLRLSEAQYFTSVRLVMNNKSVAIDESLANNPFYLKYASKITTLQQ